MDRDDLDNPDAVSPHTHKVSGPILSYKDALHYVDSKWFMDLQRKARWMDLIGDFAGDEPFVLDGESLLQLVLDDPLLALGRVGDPASFQIVHAYQTLERFLKNLLSRSANFDIVFWQDNRYATLRVGESKDIVAPRALARILLHQHLKKLSSGTDFEVKTFQGLDDPSWREYENEKKPMFVMINHGGEPSENASLSALALVLLQRAFVYELLSKGFSVTSLSELEFKDSKILAFVHEGNYTSRSDVSKIFKMATRKKFAFDAELSKNYPGADTLFSDDDLQVPQAYPDIIGQLARQLLDGIVSPDSAKTNHRFLHPLTYLFVLHLALLEGVPLKLRARNVPALHPDVKHVLMNEFIPRAFFITAATLARSGASLDIDGRIFISLVHYVCSPGPQIAAELSSNALVNQIWSDLKQCPPNLGVFAAFAHGPTVSHPSRPTANGTNFGFGLLPFSNPVFDAHLSSVQIALDAPESLESFSSESNFDGSTLFSDTTHWHNSKSLLPPHLGGDTQKPLTQWQQNKRLKREQRFMSNLQKQAETLTGASGKIIQRIVIPAVGASSKSQSKQTARLPVQKAKPEKALKNKKLSSKDQLLLKIKQEKESKNKDSSSAWWLGQLAVLKIEDIPSQIKHLTSLINNPRSREDWAGTEMRLYRLHLELTRWVAESYPDASVVHDRYSLSILQMVKDICDRKYVTAPVSDVLSSVLRSLGFEDYARSLVSPSVDVRDDQGLTFSFIKLFRSKDQVPKYSWMKIREHPSEWQLRLFGEFMDRSMDGSPDSRVSFEPDAWQRKVLDCIDRRTSLLVVAPTSAGKTFISYYAMERVLRESDSGILVYVAPTKALVTQIAAEVYARFSKELKGKTVWAIHTRDHRIHNPQNCQILITVPEVLSIMLLSPTLAKNWLPHLRWVCLDEIHCIGQQEGGSVWEQLILMAPCPIIGLSATIGDPQMFSDWLGSVQRAHGFEYEFIQHPHRYSHLRKYIYLLDSRDNKLKPFKGLSSHEHTNRSRFIHPITTLSFGARFLPEDLALEPRDTLTLYHVLREVCTAPDDPKIVAALNGLNPGDFFPSTSGQLLRQKDVLRYEAQLKEIVSRLAGANDRLDSQSLLRRVIAKLDSTMESKVPAQQVNVTPPPKALLDNLIFFLSDLHVAGELPAILFSFDRTGCEKMVKVVNQALIDAERTWRAQDPTWSRKVQEWEKWKERAKDRKRAGTKQAKKKKDADDFPEDTTPSSWQSSFDPTEPSQQFSFADYHCYSKSELEEDIQSMTGWVQPWALSALRRGIAVHHSGMNKGYRALVESLFRKGFLRVVIATGTLALGINAPAKTSVFCGDSVFLTALMYRQCAGRAGRRGFDLLGKVVFYGLSMDRVYRLILSRLPSLQGSFALTSTLNLRLFNLLHGSDYAEISTRTVNSLMSLSRISLSSEVGQQQLLHHMRFSIEYLQRARLLDEKGRPMNLFAMAAHLYYTEPSNLALVALLRKGFLHRISRLNDTDAKQKFILLMCHLFGRRYLSKTALKPQYLEPLVKKYPSIIVLPSLDPDARRILVEHEDQTLKIYCEYAQAYCRQHAGDISDDCKLPLSQLDYSASQSSTSIPLGFHQYLEQTANRFTTRSLFVASSGHLDVFGTVQELTSTVTEGVHLHSHAVPSFGEIIAEGDEEKTLNAYLYDFYTHGQTPTLANANGIRHGDIWYLLQDFSLTLLTLKWGLEQLLTKISKEYTPPVAEEETLENGDGLENGIDDIDEENEAEAGGFGVCPPGVSKEDWRVYQVVRDATAEYQEKFKAMWA
ncbi:hypothetical protein D9758_006936 [Tetrapyrgos nigripes]|uniref:P-loop containing nucleoside triphosphate hydrolase protein n=1 Tax=Tetrapyrgos nigripes TaxID=182062 RepID=A0A8H5LUU4_9AGAR|nr:hypothetical protein D9758_006936 [Tetrapyrgos nigripes]